MLGRDATIPARSRGSRKDQGEIFKAFKGGFMVQAMKIKKFLFVVILCFLCAGAAGCIYFVAGGVGALGGYAISPDTVEGESESDYDTLWDSANEVMGIMGTVNRKDYKMGTIDGTVSGARINIDMSQISSNEVRLRVKARKNMLPNIKIAQDVFVKIKNRARQ